MAAEITDMMETVSTLGADERAELAYRVLLTLDDGPQQEDPETVASEWEQESLRRLDEYERGDAEAHDARETHAAIRRRLATRAR